MQKDSETLSSISKQNRLDGHTGELWEPVWEIRTSLLPIEQELLQSAPLRRLHFLHLNGPAYIHTQYTNTRLQHTLGVFSLIADLCPDNVYLRVAALLHDIGHAPFSHMLESLDGVDHHQWTIDRLNSSPIANILQTHKLETTRLLAHISGKPTNPLRNSNGIVHADHFDAWVRNAHSIGCLPISASDIRKRLQVNNGFIEMDGELALIVLELIYLEAQLHCSDASLGTQTVLRRLVQQLLDEGVVSADQLFDMTDSTLEHLMRTTSSTQDEAHRLWYNPEELVVQKIENEVPLHNSHVVSMNSLYISQPLVNGKSAAEILPQANEILEKIEKLRGQYMIMWIK